MSETNYQIIDETRRVNYVPARPITASRRGRTVTWTREGLGGKLRTTCGTLDAARELVTRLRRGDDWAHRVTDRFAGVA